MDRLNSHFLRPHQLAPRVVSGDGQSALVDKLGEALADLVYSMVHIAYHQWMVQ
jgi:hypothetical protein